MYEYPVAVSGLALAALFLTPALDQVVVFDNLQRFFVEHPTDRMSDLGVVLSDVLLIDLPGGAPAKIEIHAPETDLTISSCPDLSPKNSYLVARTYRNAVEPGLLLFNLHGEIIQEIKTSTLAEHGIHWLQCPVWQPDEEGFFFLGATYEEVGFFAKMSLYHYALATQVVLEHKVVHLRPDYFTFSAFPDTLTLPVVSPDGTFIAFYYTYTGPPVAVAVVSPSGKIHQVDLPELSLGLAWFASRN